MKRIIRQIVKQYPQYKDLENRFFPGATDDEIKDFEEKINMIVPDSFRLLYETYNGEKEYIGSVLEFSLMNINKILQEIKYLKKLPDVVTSVSENTVRPDGFKKGWIPFADDADGSFIIIDMNPDCKGTVGQVIAFDCREWKTFVLAKSLDDFLKKIFEKIETNEITMTDGGVLSWKYGYDFSKF